MGNTRKYFTLQFKEGGFISAKYYKTVISKSGHYKILLDKNDREQKVIANLKSIINFTLYTSTKLKDGRRKYEFNTKVREGKVCDIIEVHCHQS